MKILLIDNYDSFTFNLVHLLKEVGEITVSVIRNDRIKLDTVNQYTHILLSPGPGIPSEAGLMNEVIKLGIETNKSILGVCLGHQALSEYFGGKLINLKKVYHGRQDTIEVKNKSKLFLKLPDKILVGRYHSWVADKSFFPKELEVTAISSDDQIMAFQHSQKPIFGVQFHPESIMTEHGKQIITNWIKA